VKGAELRKERLHGSLSDPVLDTMNFLNEITFRYPEAISFAPGRPYDGFFETEHIFPACLAPHPAASARTRNR
jgi:(S)-3,5-dihydroxyphenylglycine transaminase